jgi:hypothetical protein
VGLTTPLLKESTARKSSEPMEENHGGGQNPHRVVAPLKKKRKENFLP